MFSSATISVNGTDWKNASVQVRGRRERGERERERGGGGGDERNLKGARDGVKKEKTKR